MSWRRDGSLPPAGNGFNANFSSVAGGIFGTDAPAKPHSQPAGRREAAMLKANHDAIESERPTGGGDFLDRLSQAESRDEVLQQQQRQQMMMMQQRQEAVQMRQQQQQAAEDEYEMEAILNVRCAPNGMATHFLIKWVGYPVNESTWEPARKVLEVAPDVVQRHRQQQQQKQAQLQQQQQQQLQLQQQRQMAMMAMQEQEQQWGRPQQRQASPRRSASPRPGGGYPQQGYNQRSSSPRHVPQLGRTSSPRPGGPRDLYDARRREAQTAPRGSSPRMGRDPSPRPGAPGHRNSTSVLAPPGGHSSICFG